MRHSPVLPSKSSWALLHPSDCYAVNQLKADVLGSFGNRKPTPFMEDKTLTSKLEQMLESLISIAIGIFLFVWNVMSLRRHVPSRS